MAQVYTNPNCILPLPFVAPALYPWPMSDDWYHLGADDAHRTRERKKAQELKKTQWWKNILGKGLCHYCGQKFSPKELTMDHVVPVSRGGTSTKGNVVPACKKCNT